MAKSKISPITSVNAAPIKSFFVSMLTRDISLEEAILDLLDNCVDGVVRSQNRRIKSKPYSGFRADIKFNRKSFSISDNCGGIPPDLLKYAFNMGRDPERPDDAFGTVGVYGIGMKRAIFKMGKRCIVNTQNGNHSYEIEISPEWIANESVWDIPVHPAKEQMTEDGTKIIISQFYDGVEGLFSTHLESFSNALERTISTHFAFIIDKGFCVSINGKEVKPRPTSLVFKEQVSGKETGIRPFIYKTVFEGVKVFLVVGFTRPIPTQEEITNEHETKQYSSIDAGWTVICNDRAVLYCNRDELTGWGEAGIPRYHTQFISISGIVEFKADDASKLPTTTTKRGIDASSRLYLQIKNKMREGMRMFIDYTNEWKGRADESRKHIENVPTLTLVQIKEKKLTFNKTKKSFPEGEQIRPKLPTPKKLKAEKRISFLKSTKAIECVSDHLFNADDVAASDVGEKCFDIIYKEAKK